MEEDGSHSPLFLPESLDNIFVPSSVIARLWEEINSLRHEVTLLREEVNVLKGELPLKKLKITPKAVVTKRTQEEVLLRINEMIDGLIEIKRLNSSE
jgi:hypothetical protein